MTPERADELAQETWKRICADKAWSAQELADELKQAILQACAEQREEDAKICRTRGDKSGDDYEAGGCYGCETAIREGK